MSLFKALLSNSSHYPLYAFIFIFYSCGLNQEQHLKIKNFSSARVQALTSQFKSLTQPTLDSTVIINIWASDSLVIDPVFVDFDDQWSLYYSRTNRQKNSAHEIRRHQDSEIRSIALQSVEERRVLIRQEISADNSEQNEWIKDLNECGVHDRKDMMIEKDHIYRLEDKDGDVLANQYQLVFEDLHAEATDVAGAVMKHGDFLLVGAALDLCKWLKMQLQAWPKARSLFYPVMAYTFVLAAKKLKPGEAPETLENSNLLYNYKKIKDDLYADNILAGYENSLFRGDIARKRKVFFQNQNA